VEADNCSVSEVATSPDRVSFKRQDRALPFFPEKARGILKWAPLLEEMNHYGLKVTGLKEGRYEIRFGGKKAAVRSAAELGKGVNLAEAALREGPVAEQVKKVWAAVEGKNGYFHDQVFRGVVLAGGKRSPEERRTLYEERMKKMPGHDAAV